MGRTSGSLRDRALAFITSPWPVAALLTLVTLATAGGVALVLTPAGCRLGFHSSSCRSSAGPIVNSTPLAPEPRSSPRSIPSNPVYPPAASGPYPPVASGPYPPVASQPYPPPDLHNPNAPYQYDTGTSGAFPPTYPETSGSTPGIFAFSCRLPIFNGGPGSGGFLAFPDLSFTPDPRSGVTVPSPSPGSASPPPPQGPGPGGPQGFFGLSYDRAAARWVPVPRTWISPDGKRFAYPDPLGGIFVVDVASNTQTEVGAGQRWQVLDVEAEGVYATQFTNAGLVAGLWLLPFAGSPSQLTNAGYWIAVGGGAAYGTATSAVPNGVANLIDRFDLTTHTTQHWFQVNNASSYLFGFDAAGHPIFNVSGFGPNYSPSELWLVTGLGTAEVIAFNNNYNGPPVADSHGIWLMTYQQTWLLVPGKGLFLAANIGGQLAGGCA